MYSPAQTPPLTPIIVGGWPPGDAAVVNGIYAHIGSHHEKPCFAMRKPGNRDEYDAYIYFWDLRDGPVYAGWWIAPAIGSPTAWARRVDSPDALPPKDGWRHFPSQAPAESLLILSGSPPTVTIPTPDTVAIPQLLQISGWHAHGPVDIDGVYAHKTTNHCKPVYVKEQERDKPAMAIYFWDVRDGVSYAGRWIGPTVGDTVAWAHHGDCSTAYPPACKWQTHPNGAEMNRVFVMPFFQFEGPAMVEAVALPSSWETPHVIRQADIGGPPEQIKKPREEGHPGKQQHEQASATRRSISRSPSSARTPPPKKQRISGMRKNFGAATPYADEGNSVYALFRKSASPPWPWLISEKGKLIEAHYSGDGIPLFICNPRAPMRRIHPEDFNRVMQNIKREFDIDVSKMKPGEQGPMQVRFGEAKGVGSLQLYLTISSRVTGNARLSIGPKEVERLKSLRLTLLKSEWFHEVAERTARMIDKDAAQAFKDEKKIPLPTVSENTEDRDLLKIITTVHSIIGKAARRGLEEYFFQICGLERNRKLTDMIEKAFGE